MKKILCLLLLSILTLKAQAATAVYYSKNENQIYVKIKQATEDIAKQKTNAFCSELNNDCQLVSVSRQGGYGAIAQNKKSSFSVALARPSKQAATKDALKDCNKNYGGCKIVDLWNDTVYLPKEVLEKEAAEDAKIQAMNQNPYQCSGYMGALRDCNSIYDVNGKNYLTGKYYGQ